jgi:hypothetical protein
MAVSPGWAADTVLASTIGERLVDMMTPRSATIGRGYHFGFDSTDEPSLSSPVTIPQAVRFDVTGMRHHGLIATRSEA